jgi:localization factor PodJL
MSKFTTEHDNGAAMTSDRGRANDAGCRADDLKGMLAELTRQFAEADRRNGEAMRDMQGRLELIGRGAERIREQVPQHYASAFARIEDGVQSLADRMAVAGRERDVQNSTNSPVEQPRDAAPFVEQQTAAPAHNGIPSASQVVQPKTLAREKEPMADVPACAASSFAAPTADEPWDDAAADALTRLYESGEADVRAQATKEQAAFAAFTYEAPAAMAASFVPQPPPMLDQPALTNDRAWLAERFAAIAERIEQSAAAIRPESNFALLDERLGQLETRFGAAMQDVATRSDVDGLRIVEAHLNELVTQFEHTEQQLGRLDSIEQHLGLVTQQLSDERMGQMFAQIQAPANVGPSEDDIEAVAAAVAERVASRIGTASDAGARDQSTVTDLKRVIDGFAAGQRETEEHTATMLDTMQQAMIRMLDRMDAIENAPPSFASSPQVNFAPAAAMAPTFTSTQAAAPTALVVNSDAGQAASTKPAGARIAPDFAFEHANSPAEMAAARAAAAGQPKEDFRAAAAADARRAARKVAAQAPEGPSLDVEPARVRRGAPSVQLGATEKKSEGNAARLRAPMMVAGVALVAAIGVLAASVGLNRSGLIGSSQQTADRKSGLAVDDGTETSEATGLAGKTGGNDKTLGGETLPSLTPSPQIEQKNPAPRVAPAGALPRPGAMLDQKLRLRPGTELSTEGATDGQNNPADAAASAQEASYQPSGNAAASPPMGMIATRVGGISPDSDLARARQQRNMASLANQLAAVQANAPAVPASLMPDGIAPPQAGIETSQPAELPPAAIGPMSLRNAAQKGDPSAEFEIAARFAEGRGITQDFKQAIVWYQRSAQRGFAPAQYRLGTLFERGIGTKADAARAKVWYGRAAEQGHVKAMHNLAVMNAGRDPSADYAVAIQWFTEAAERGLADSQYNLGVLYESGLGLQRDYKLAYQWLSLAARGGDKDAGRRRDQVRGKLEEAELAAIEAGVDAWRAKPSDSAVNDARVAGEAWKSRQSVSR